MSESLVKYLFVLFAIVQGCLVLGLTIFIFGYYLPKKVEQFKNGLRWHVIAASFSYILLTLATIKTASVGVYGWGDLWYWVVAIAYIIGDISLIYVFKHAVKRKKIEEEFLIIKNKSMPEQNTTTVETEKELSGKLVFGIAGLNNPTPKWATWVFRIIFLLTSAALVIIAADNSISDEIKFRIALYLKASDVVIWGIARGLGVDKSQFTN